MHAELQGVCRKHLTRKCQACQVWVVMILWRERDGVVVQNIDSPSREATVVVGPYTWLQLPSSSTPYAHDTLRIGYRVVRIDAICLATYSFNLFRSGSTVRCGDSYAPFVYG